MVSVVLSGHCRGEDDKRLARSGVVGDHTDLLCPGPALLYWTAVSRRPTTVSSRVARERAGRWEPRGRHSLNMALACTGLAALEASGAVHLRRTGGRQGGELVEGGLERLAAPGGRGGQGSDHNLQEQRRLSSNDKWMQDKSKVKCCLRKVLTWRYSGKSCLAATGPEVATAPATRCGYFSLRSSLRPQTGAGGTSASQPRSQGRSHPGLPRGRSDLPPT